VSEDYELLSQVHASTPMGSFLRQFWLPALRSKAVVAGDVPRRFSLFGEALVAFRAPDSSVGVLQERCPHRGVSLALARVEGDALRCIYHGWQIGVDGRLREAPTEPKAACADLIEAVRITRYPTHEMGGVIWVWAGSGDPPPFPRLPFDELPSDHVTAYAGELDCHWLQAIEMLLDPVHIGILHRSHLVHGQLNWQKDEGEVRLPIGIDDPPPRIEIEQTAYGFRGAALRTLDDGDEFVRVTEWVKPFFSFLANRGQGTNNLYIATPLGERKTALWYIGWDKGRPLDEAKLKANALGGGDPDNFTSHLESAGSLWGQDRKLMEDGHFTGFPTAMHEEAIVPQAQGEMQDISQQTLGYSDGLIRMARKMLIDGAKQFLANGRRPVNPTDLRQLRPVAGFQKPGAAWRDLTF